MKTDNIFYKIFTELPRTFFELIGLNPNQAQQYRFDSVEVKQTAFRIDGVFLPLVNDPEIPIYFAEVQFQKDPELYARLFSEIFLYLRTNKVLIPWRAVIIFRSRAVEPDADHRIPYEPLLNSPWVTRIYLQEWKQQQTSVLNLKLIQLILARKKQINPQVNTLIEQVKGEVRNQLKQNIILDLIQTIVLYKLPKISKQELESMFSVENLKKTRFAQEMKQEGVEEGIERGIEQGIERGERRVKLKTIPRLYARGMSIQDIAETLELDIEQVQQIVNAQEHL